MAWEDIWGTGGKRRISFWPRWRTRATTSTKMMTPDTAPMMMVRLLLPLSPPSSPLPLDCGRIAVGTEVVGAAVGIAVGTSVGSVAVGI